MLLAVVLTAAAAQFTIPLPFTAVPFTLTPLVVMLTGAVLGSRLGFVTQALYLAAGAVGLAVFTPSLTLPPGALAPRRTDRRLSAGVSRSPRSSSGWLAERGWDRRYLTSFASMLVGLAVIFAGGVSWLAIAFTQLLPARIRPGRRAVYRAGPPQAGAAATVLPGAWTVVADGRTEFRRPKPGPRSTLAHTRGLRIRSIISRSSGAPAPVALQTRGATRRS